jgi:hypothetical protein
MHMCQRRYQNGRRRNGGDILVDHTVMGTLILEIRNGVDT